MSHPNAIVRFGAARRWACGVVCSLAACRSTAGSDAAPVSDVVAADTTPVERVPLASRGPLPPAAPTPAPPTVDPPAGTPTDPGTITQILAVDRDRAVVVFRPYQSAGTPSPVLALMRADGTIAWSVTIVGEPLRGRTSTGIELVGDAVSIAIAAPHPLHPVLDRIEVYGLADGELRGAARAADESYARDTVVDRGLRIDTVLGTGSRAEVIASDARGVRWRARHGTYVDDEIVALADRIAVPTTAADDGKQWQVFSRSDGSPVGTVRGTASCSDGERWYVLDYDELYEIDPADLSRALVVDAGNLPTTDVDAFTRGDLADQWILRDCTIVEGKPVAFAQLGMIEGLVVPDAAGPRFASLGVRRMREGDVDPLPDRLHPFALLRGLDGAETYDIVATDLAKADRQATGALQSWVGVQGVLHLAGPSRGYVVATRDVVGVVDGKTGAMTGHHVRRDAMALHRTQLAGHHLWLPPAPGLVLGRAAPTVLDLSLTPRDAALRGALATALGSQRGGAPAVTCGSMGEIRYDGIETAAGMGPVSPSREPPWDAEHIAIAARRFACAGANAIVTTLAWSVVEDSRPLRNHNLLALVEDTVDGTQVYTVVAMYRHATNIEWNISVSFHDPSSPLRRFVRRPTTADLDAFVDQSDFSLVDGWGSVRVGNVLDSRWSLVTGEPPLRRFAPGIEQAD